MTLPIIVSRPAISFSRRLAIVDRVTMKNISNATKMKWDDVTHNNKLTNEWLSMRICQNMRTILLLIHPTESLYPEEYNSSKWLQQLQKLWLFSRRKDPRSFDVVSIEMSFFLLVVFFFLAKSIASRLASSSFAINSINDVTWRSL